MNFTDQYGPWALVAGASEGLGVSVSRLLGERGINVVLVAQERMALEEVAETVATETRTLAVDLSRADATDALADATADLEVGLLVYVAGGDPNNSRFLDKPSEVWRLMVQRNCVTVLGSAHHFGALMAGRGKGAMVFVTSGAAWAGGCYLATYAASKAFDLIFGEALWAELGPAGVHVLSMVLGPTDTPAYRRLLKGRNVEGLADPDDVARTMLDNLDKGPTYPAGPSPFSAMTRRDAVELMSRGTAALQE